LDPKLGIEEGLQLIRLRQRRMGHVLVGLVPFILVAASTRQLPPDWEIAYLAAAAAYGVLLLSYCFRVAFTECPRCGNFFHWNWWADPWAKKCLHCALPLESSG
jgi:hypothetical protein